MLNDTESVIWDLFHPNRRDKGWNSLNERPKRQIGSDIALYALLTVKTMLTAA